jgi:hypothetical protein
MMTAQPAMAVSFPGELLHVSSEPNGKVDPAEFVR